MVFAAIADGVTRGVDAVTDMAAAPFADPVIRLGVTGLSRAGKTVFITSLVANLMDRARMSQLTAARSGAIRTAFLQPQPDDTIPRFPYEDHVAALTAAEPRWPEGTRRISELRLSLRVQPTGLLSGFQGPRTVHLDIVDYPGEWLLDLGLMDRSYAEWSATVLDRIGTRTEAEAFRAQLEGVDPAASFDEPAAKALARGFTDYLNAARAAGYSDCTPGRFILPGDLEGSPVLTFAPLPEADGAGRKALIREMERRFEAYKAKVVKPFFRDHFARIDRQVVLLDALGAIHKGPRAVEDMRRAMSDILGAFRPGRNAFLSRLLSGKRVEKILFAATKADHLHHAQHPALTAIVEAMLREAADRARFAGAETKALALASVRATVEEELRHEGEVLPCVRGKLMDSGKQAAFYPGELPSDPAKLLQPARSGAEGWLGGDYQIMNFSPAVLDLSPGDGPPHIRLDRAAEFLIGDRL